jgi:hypothetical protein
MLSLSDLSSLKLVGLSRSRDSSLHDNTQKSINMNESVYSNRFLGFSERARQNQFIK